MAKAGLSKRKASPKASKPKSKEAKKESRSFLKKAGTQRKAKARPRPQAVNSFPKGFLWGTATSAHQVEGFNHNSWSEWEKLPGKIVDGTVSGPACEQYKRFARDIADLKRLNTTSYRFSLEWSRLEPEPGRWDDKEFAHYARVLAELKKNSLVPMVTLHHFTNPLWFEEMGGFANPSSISLFGRFAREVAQRLGSGVRLWCTINEPVIYTYFGYITGKWPPGKMSLKLGRRVFINLLFAHAAAYKSLHQILGPAIQVGIAKHFRIFDPLRPTNPFDRYVSQLYDRIFNLSFCQALLEGLIPWPLARNKRIPELAGTLDFLGINYYSREMVRFRPTRPESLFAEYSSKLVAPKNSLGWEIYPEGLYRVVKRCSAWGIPLYITENGTSVRDDRVRQAFIINHLRELQRAILEGADVRGYYYWSSLDNFEWTEGYTAKFGLYAVDFKTQKRTLRPSGKFFSQIAKNNGLVLG